MRASRRLMRGLMRARPSILVLTAIMVMSTAVFVCDAKIYGATAEETAQPRADVVAAVATAVAAPRADEPVAQPGVAFDGLEVRIKKAIQEANAAGATVSVTVLDRVAHQLLTNGDTMPISTASVAKLFIADDLLYRSQDTGSELSADERADLDSMLRSSDDGAAIRFWNLGGGSAIITRVAARYGLSTTTPGYDGAWWNTNSTTMDLVRYYDMLLDGSGGLPAKHAGIIIGNLARSTPIGLDGYPQRFGIPDGLYDEPVAVKQGWMLCVGNNWMHLSTGVIGSDLRYIVAVESLQPTDEFTARETITETVKTMFPTGRI